MWRVKLSFDKSPSPAMVAFKRRIAAPCARFRIPHAVASANRATALKRPAAKIPKFPRLKIPLPTIIFIAENVPFVNQFLQHKIKTDNAPSLLEHSCQVSTVWKSASLFVDFNDWVDHTINLRQSLLLSIEFLHEIQTPLVRRRSQYNLQ